jgi:hypothetical protein
MASLLHKAAEYEQLKGNFGVAESVAVMVVEDENKIV